MTRKERAELERLRERAERHRAHKTDMFELRDCLADLCQLVEHMAIRELQKLDSTTLRIEQIELKPSLPQRIKNEVRNRLSEYL